MGNVISYKYFTNKLEDKVEVNYMAPTEPLLH